MVDPIDRNELLEYVWRCRLDSRERIDELVRSMPTLPYAHLEKMQLSRESTTSDCISRKAAIDALEWKWAGKAAIDAVKNLPSAQPDNNMIHLQKEQAYLQGWEEGREALRKEQRWTPVTLETLPNPNSVVVVCGKKGTWDYGTYRGWHGDIHSWWWKKNSIKHVYWWMYKDDAMSLPYRKEGGE